MPRGNIKFILLMLLIMYVTFSCATIPELKINYRMALDADRLTGTNVGIGFMDDRRDRNIFGPGAEERFRGFPGNFTLSVSRGEEDGLKIGLFDLKSLFIEVFKRKLENQGIIVDPSGSDNHTRILIVLKDFRLDLIERKWIADMNYEARLVIDGNLRATQTISGSAERLRLLGNDEAHILMGELFSDIVNKLDVTRLFRQGNVLK